MPPKNVTSEYGQLVGLVQLAAATLLQVGCLYVRTQTVPRSNRGPACPLLPVCNARSDPADTIKARLQVQGAAAVAGEAGRYRGTLDAVAKAGQHRCLRHASILLALAQHSRPCAPPNGAQVARSEGLYGFYRGFSAAALGSVPGNLAYFAGYELAKEALPGALPRPRPPQQPC
jgi:hypothetical protein